jgi:hypothetical protein
VELPYFPSCFGSHGGGVEGESLGVVEGLHAFLMGPFFLSELVPASQMIDNK